MRSCGSEGEKIFGSATFVMLGTANRTTFDHRYLKLFDRGTKKAKRSLCTEGVS